ncbi:rhomboid family intramembrane serine protease [Actinomyces slackii]|uniref:Rhomboid protease gluP n=1 Tax=Actinomyces slackii TaxID=52774 RepID=A0A3S4SE22_9ACTO|nr:rhomboid family intramembrane serine protease [Actinomyces slackii]VEG73949.1 Rhomboid protease gluP [Actinomyces slackii]
MTQSLPDAPTCPRHPGTVAYVSCQRCDRPVCPACQVPSAVGVHCVDCARAASSRRRGARTVLGATPGQGSLVSTTLIGLCLVTYGAQFVIPSLTTQLGFAPVVAVVEPWRFLTTAFLHGGIMHLAFNMWALWVLGGSLEPLLGRWRFTSLYLLSALGGSTAIYWLASPGTDAWWTVTVGASGAVFGLFATMFIIQRRFGRDTSQIVVLLVINAAISVMGANISWQGHLGGLLAGGALAAVFAWAPRGRRTQVGLAGTVGLAVALVGLIALRAALV